MTTDTAIKVGDRVRLAKARTHLGECGVVTRVLGGLDVLGAAGEVHYEVALDGGDTIMRASWNWAKE